MSKYDKIDPEFKAKWVSALRSGDYLQTEGSLRTIQVPGVTPGKKGFPPLGFCCLGVACDIIDPDGWQGEDAADSEGSVGWREYSSSETTNLEFLPVKTTDEDGSVGRFLAAKNDSDRISGKRWTFAEIADWIEENL